MDIAQKRFGAELRWQRKGLLSGVLSAALYAAETWTLTQTDRRFEDFEMWIWSRMEKID